MMRTISLLVCLTSLSGCLVLPGGERTPFPLTVEGTLFRDGAPLPDQQVSIAFGTRLGGCERATFAANTNAAGHFSSAPNFDGGSWRVVPLAPSSPTYFLTVCTAVDAKPRALFSGEYYGAPPTTLTLSCDLGDASSDETLCEAEVVYSPTDPRSRAFSDRRF